MLLLLIVETGPMFSTLVMCTVGKSKKNHLKCTNGNFKPVNANR